MKSSALFWSLLPLCSFTLVPSRAAAHGSLENGRMLQVIIAGPNGHTPAPWNDSYYTWNQNSQNFPAYANPGFAYAATVPDGTLASAGINDGVHSSLNFSGLNNASPNWQQTNVAAGGSVPLHFLATAPHDPSHFLVFMSKTGVNPDTKVLAWADMEFLGSWAVGNSTRPVTTSTRPHPVPAIGGTLFSYDMNVPVPGDRAGHVAVLVIWQRDDPAGEAFFAMQDLRVTAAPAAAPQLAVTAGTNGVMNLNLRGTPGQTYDLQAADDLSNAVWNVLATGTPDSSGSWPVSDATAGNRPRRYYRVIAR